MELSAKYRVPLKIGRSWLQNDYLVPLLDGLDEVSTTLQPDCVTAINDFIDRSEPSGIVVCCRLMEYQWLPKRLKLNGAICIESLSPEEVNTYLANGGSKLAALRDAVNNDSVLQDLAQTPLMLSIMSLAFQGAGINELATQKGDSPDERRKQIFGLYVEQMFRRKETTSLSFPKEKIIGWLSWLAEKMREHSQSEFLVEGLRPSWLGTRAQRGAYGAVAALSFGLFFALIIALSCGLGGGLSGGLNGLIVALLRGRIAALILGVFAFVGVGLGCWSESSLKNGVMSGSIAGLIGGVFTGVPGGLNAGLSVGLIFGLTTGLLGGLGVGPLNHIALVETMTWKWNQFWKRTIPGSIVGLIFGLIIGLIYGAFYTLNFGRSEVARGMELFDVLVLGLASALIVAPIFGLVSSLVGGFTDRVKVGKASPNQGIKLSQKNSLAAFLVTWLTVGLIFGLIVGLIFALIVGLIAGLSAGLIVGLN